MNDRHEIDGEEPLFDFDTFEPIDDSSAPLTSPPALPDLSHLSHIPQFPDFGLPTFSPIALAETADVVDFVTRNLVLERNGYSYMDDSDGPFKGKGKAVSRPMDIVPRDTTDSQFDLFSFTSGSSGSARSHFTSVASSSKSTPQTLYSVSFSPSAALCTVSDDAYIEENIIQTSPGSSYVNDALMNDEEDPSEGKGKGKTRETPRLPPLATTDLSDAGAGGTNELDMSSMVRLSSTSPGTPYMSNSSPETVSVTPAVASSPNAPFVHRLPTRTRSFSSLSARSVESIASRSISNLKLKLGKVKSTSSLARKLLLRADNTRTRNIAEADDDYGLAFRRRGSRLSVSAPSTPGVSTSRITPVDIDAYMRPVTATEPDSYVPEPPQDLFDSKLPRELRLDIFAILVLLYEAEGDAMIRSTDWTTSKASSKTHRWIGRNEGLVELVKISRVSNANAV